MQQTFSIITPTAEDYPELTALWEASVRATHHFLTEKDIQYFKPLVQNEFLKAVDLFCIKNEAGEIVGFSGLSGDSLEMLFVRPDYTGQGVGKFLLRHALEQWGVKKVDVNEQNPQALAFYEHMRFRVVSRSPVDMSGKPFPILHLERP